MNATIFPLSYAPPLRRHSWEAITCRKQCKNNGAKRNMGIHERLRVYLQFTFFQLAAQVKQNAFH